MLTVNAASGFGSGGGAGGVESVNFDGSNDYLTRGAGLTGAADNKVGLFSFWLNIKGGDGTTRNIFQGGDTTLHCQLKTSDKMGINLVDTAPAVNIWNVTTDDTFLVADGWKHFLASFDASASDGAVYISDAGAANDTPDTAVVAYSDAVGNWTVANFSIGAVNNGTGKLNADVAELYITNEFLDLSVEANRRKFIGADGKPVDLGDDGSEPTGTAPLVYFKNPLETWHINAGSGGGFTESGELTAGTDSPSD
jgi:hypothetical protein|tara:strand:+ start:10 stop:768 length:759 start_codon:yes stop_codon:yes gene_type:complete